MKKKKFNKNEFFARLLAFMFIVWTVCGVLGTIAFFRTKADSVCVASAETVDEETVKEYRFNLDIFNSMVFSTFDDTYNAFDGYFEYYHSSTSLGVKYISGSYQITFPYSSNNAGRVYYIPALNSADSQFGDIVIQFWTASYSNVNRERLSVIPDMRESYPRRYYLSLLGYDVGGSTSLGSCAFEIGIEYFSPVSLYTSILYITIDTSFIEPDMLFMSLYGHDVSTGGVNDWYPITPLDYSYMYGGSYLNGYNAGYSAGESSGETKGYQNGYSAGETKGYTDGYNVGKSDGYQNGYSAGQSAGYQNGYDVGVNTKQDSSYNEGFEDGAETGYSDGYNSGKTYGITEGYVQGYDEGEKAGFSEGDATGYQRGLNDANTFTFANLLGAVFDVPVQTFQSTFNFEILGVNLKSFLLAILTALIAIGIIKLFI